MSLNSQLLMIYINDRLNDFDLDEALAQLSEQRREQSLRFKHEAGRRQSAAAYLLLCEALQKEYGITEKPLFDYGEHGKPTIVGHPDIHFNLSHCREAAVCVVSSQPVGIDVESFREYKDSLVRYTMNEHEQQLIAQAERPEVEFTRLWTQKEAVLKLQGTGLRNDMKTVLTGTDVVRTVVNLERGYVYSVAALSACPCDSSTS